MINLSTARIECSDDQQELLGMCSPPSLSPTDLLRKSKMARFELSTLKNQYTHNYLDHITKNFFRSLGVLNFKIKRDQPGLKRILT